MPTLYIAMKNINGAKFRINVQTLQGWTDRFSKDTTYRRVFYIVEKSRMPVLTAQAQQYLVALEDEGITLPPGVDIENSWIVDSSCPRAILEKRCLRMCSYSKKFLHLEVDTRRCQCWMYAGKHTDSCGAGSY